jgi:hypothetical protein
MSALNEWTVARESRNHGLGCGHLGYDAELLSYYRVAVGMAVDRTS